MRVELGGLVVEGTYDEVISFISWFLKQPDDDSDSSEEDLVANSLYIKRDSSYPTDEFEHWTLVGHPTSMCVGNFKFNQRNLIPHGIFLCKFNDRFDICIRRNGVFYSDEFSKDLVEPIGWHCLESWR